MIDSDIKDKIKERLLNNIEIITESGCWIWMKHLNPDGYGMIRVKDKMYRAHRASYEIFKDKEIDSTKMICHVCCVKSCINPYHLVEGTAQDNANHEILANRTSLDSRNPNRKLLDKDVLEIIDKYKNKNYSTKQLGEEYNVTPKSICRILNGKGWKHITKAEDIIKNPCRRPVIATKNYEWYYINDKETVKNRILNNIEIITETGCWIWMGSQTEHGYGITRFNKKRYRAHRISYEIFNNKQIEESKILCHTCNVKECVNPNHVYEGTPETNANDIAKTGMLTGERCPASKLTIEEVKHIIIEKQSGISNRELGLKYNISHSVISDIILGVTWKSITGK